MDIKEVRDMLRLIPNDISVCLEDLMEIWDIQE